MHDLNQIAQANEAGFQKGVHAARAAGKHVVVKYAGLRVESYRSFEERFEAAQFIENQDDSPDVRRDLLLPIPADLVVGAHDQSEDRA